MRVAGRQRLDDFIARHPNARNRALAWLAEVEDAQWEEPNALKRRYSSVSFIPTGGGKRVVFNLGGNRYRIDALVDYGRQLLLIVRAGSHAEYDSWTF